MANIVSPRMIPAMINITVNFLLPPSPEMNKLIELLNQMNLLGGVRGTIFEHSISKFAGKRGL
jgi:hypothetical protein